MTACMWIAFTSVLFSVTLTRSHHVHADDNSDTSPPADAPAPAAAAVTTPNADDAYEYALRTSCSYVQYRVNAALENSTLPYGLILDTEADEALDDYKRKRNLLEFVVNGRVLTSEVHLRNVAEMLCAEAVDEVEVLCAYYVMPGPEQTTQLRQIMCGHLNEIIDEYMRAHPAAF